MSDLATLEKSILDQIAAAADEAALEAVRVSALGKKGSISALLATLGKMSPDERKTEGAKINLAKDAVTHGGVAVLTPRLAATLRHPPSGRTMEILTTAPGLQVYTGNFLDGSIHGKDGAVYHKYGGLCLETEGFPNAVNNPAFPSAVLRPGEEYRHKSIYRFSAQ